MKSRIDDKDLAHLAAFPGDQKAAVMQKIMARQPTERIVLAEDNGFEKTLLKLRREGFNLIDLQRPCESAFTCVWYRKTKSLFNGSGVDVAMLLWEMQDPKVETTVLTWRL